MAPFIDLRLHSHHNEEQTIGVLLWKIRKVMLEFGRDYEVLVLDDASTDETATVLDRYRSILPLRVLKEEHRAGYPSAVQRLLREALDRTSYPKRDAAVLLQADFTESPDYIVPLLGTGGWGRHRGRRGRGERA